MAKVIARFSVELEVPVGATRADAREYVLAAVRGWCGSLTPSEDAMAGLEQKTVVVRGYRRKKWTRKAQPTQETT